MILAGDIGGTHARLAGFAEQAGRWTLVMERIYPSRSYASLGLVIEQFLVETATKFEAVCLGVAGPVIGNRCKATNLPWVVDAAEIASQMSTPHVSLLNDLEATATGIEFLAPDQLHELQAGIANVAENRAVIAAGTGLGEAGLFWSGSRYLPFASEGGHCDFAPRDELQIELWQFLRQRYEHVSWERVLSGPGLVNIFQFLAARTPARVNADVATEMSQRPTAAVISQAALDQRCPVCAEALKLFVIFYGAEAGNLALKLMARGGVYVAGGIAPKILPALCRPEFLDAMSTGRFQSLLRSIPVRVVLTDDVALIGAAHHAAATLG